MLSKPYSVIVVGAGAAGLMCALTAAQRGHHVLLLERNKKAGAKILISGGGRCNFTNEGVTPLAYISENPHFVKSALSRYTAWDFMSFLSRYDLTWHEKTLGQLFCDQGAKAVLGALLDECQQQGVELRLDAAVDHVEKSTNGFSVKTRCHTYEVPHLVIATGGLSIPQMGATDFAYRLARQFGLRIVEPRPALVPLTFNATDVDAMKQLAGVAVDTQVSVAGNTNAPVFRENSLFTHRGLSGPAILQLSSYWQPGQDIVIDLLPEQQDITAWLRAARAQHGTAGLKTVLAEKLPARLTEQIALPWPGKMAEMSNATLEAVATRLSRWQLRPTGTEGFKKAEVTTGGIATEALSSKTMAVKSMPGLYFIGECVDVTGWLGGYNFQWAWASGYVAGQSI